MKLLILQFYPSLCYCLTHRSIYSPEHKETDKQNTYTSRNDDETKIKHRKTNIPWAYENENIKKQAKERLYEYNYRYVRKAQFMDQTEKHNI